MASLRCAVKTWLLTEAIEGPRRGSAQLFCDPEFRLPDPELMSHSEWAVTTSLVRLYSILCINHFNVRHTVNARRYRTEMASAQPTGNHTCDRRVRPHDRSSETEPRLRTWNTCLQLHRCCRRHLPIRRSAPVGSYHCEVGADDAAPALGCHSARLERLATPALRRFWRMRQG